MEVTKQTQDGTIFCERDWNEGGHGGIGVKHNVGNDSMAISAAKRSEQIKRDATMSDTKEVHGSKAGQQKNSQQSTWKIKMKFYFFDSASSASKIMLLSNAFNLVV